MSNSKNIKTVVLGILSYLVFIKSYEIPSRLYSWGCAEFNRCGGFILTYILISIISLSIFFHLFNKYINTEEFKISWIRNLIFILVVLIIGNEYVKYVYNTYANGLGATKTLIDPSGPVNILSIALPIIAVVILMRRKTN
jgi:biotin transporter BioY